MLRQDMTAVLQRNIDFAQDSTKTGLLLQINHVRSFTLPTVKPLEQCRFPQDYKSYQDARIEREKSYWKQREGLADDTLPYLMPYYGIAEHSALVGGRVVYGGDTSYHEHPVTSWDKLDTLTLDENNENFKMLMDSLRYLKERSDEVGFLAALRGAEAPMDMANAVRGNDIFTDFYDDEEHVHELIEFCLRAGKYTMEHQRKIIGQVEGGVMSGMGVWLPGNSFGHLSEDASCLCSPELYLEFGQPYTERLLEDYDCALMHVHAMGRHVLPGIAAIKKIKFIQLQGDPNQPSAIEVYRQYEYALKDKIVVLGMNKEEINSNREFLAAHKVIITYDALDMADAHETLELVRSI